MTETKTTVAELTDQELMNEIQKRGIPFVTNVKINLNNNSIDKTIKSLSETKIYEKGVFFNAVKFDFIQLMIK